MLNYYYDFEFIEGFKKTIPFLPSIGFFNKKRWFIDMISIGIRCSDGRRYKAYSSEFNECDADDWVKENVIAKLPPRYLHDFDAEPFIRHFDPAFTPMMPNPEYKTIKEISKEVFDFVNENPMGHKHDYFLELMRRGEGAMHIKEWLMKHSAVDGKRIGDKVIWYASPTFYGYYSAYDHVLLCTLFGKMIDLPPGFPMFTIDLKQMFDELCWKITRMRGNNEKGIFEVVQKMVKRMKEYPKNSDEHDAVADAEWNLELHKFIATVKTKLDSGKLIEAGDTFVISE